MSGSVFVQDGHRKRAPPENAAGCAPIARHSAESSDIYSGSTPIRDFEIGSNLAKTHSDLKQFDDAWRCIGEAISTAGETLEKWWLAEVYRTAGDIALQSASPDGTTAEAYFERALDIARAQ